MACQLNRHKLIHSGLKNLLRARCWLNLCII
jgi:hypothetical protein